MKHTEEEKEERDEEGKTGNRRRGKKRGNRRRGTRKGGKRLFLVEGNPSYAAAIVIFFLFPYLDSSSIQNLLLNTICVALQCTVIAFPS